MQDRRHSGRDNWFRIGVVSVFLLGLAAALCAVRLGGPIHRPAEGDAVYYTGLARSMAEGNGYTVPGSTSHGPHLERLPLWPVLMTAGIRLFPNAGDSAVMRCTDMLIHGATAVLIVLLSYSLWADILGALLAGVAFAVYPMALAFTMEGASEPAFVVTSLAGLFVLVCARRGWVQILGALLSGLATLSRANYVILPLAIAVAALLIDRTLIRHRTRFVILSAAFMLFPLGWVLRNYAVSGAFPLLSAMEGETLYGGNNVIVATDLDYWGYWVMPDAIPGEIPKHQLQARMGEAGITRYYQRRAVEYFRANWISYPRLLLGKLIHAFIPIPWRPVPLTYFVFLMRGLLDALFVWYAARGIVKHQLFKIYLVAMFLVVLLTSLIFYGSARFTYVFEIYLIPPCVAGVVKDLRAWFGRRKRADEPLSANLTAIEASSLSSPPLRLRAPRQ